MCLLPNQKERGEPIAEQHLQGSDAESAPVRRPGAVQRTAHPAGGCSPALVRYELRGTGLEPDKPYALVDMAIEHFMGSILSPLPLKKETAQRRLLKGKLELTSEYVQMAEFCSEYLLPIPETPIRYLLRPASPEEAGLFYAQTAESDEALGAIGHVRIDFGRSGKGFYHSWWPRGPEKLNTQEFKEELGKVVDGLREGILKDLPSMRRFCRGGEGAIEGGICCQNYGFTLETERYLYRLRCNLIEGDYQCYLSCFDKQAQKQIIGQVSYASGEREEFTDPQKYLQAVREELPYQSTTGFRCETLTDDPAVRKAVDDMVCDLYGEENPKTLEDYSKTGMMMGGIM